MRFLQDKIRTIYRFLRGIYKFEMKQIIPYMEIENSLRAMDIKAYKIDKMKYDLAMELVNKLSVEEEITDNGVSLSLELYILDKKTIDNIFNSLKVMNDYINNHDKEFIELTDEIKTFKEFIDKAKRGLI